MSSAGEGLWVTAARNALTPHSPTLIPGLSVSGAAGVKAITLANVTPGECVAGGRAHSQGSDHRIERAKWKKKLKGWKLRRVEAIVEVDGKDKVMVFITCSTQWSARSVCDVYRARGEIEVFFKQVKQTLKPSGFVDYSANAIRWQVSTAFLVYVLLRFAAHLSAWGH